MTELVSKPFCQTAKYREQQGRAERRGHWVEPNERYGPIVRFERAMVADLRSRGIPMFAHCVMRSCFDQQAVYMAGRSNAPPGQSPHQYGLAVDLIHGVHGWELHKRSWAIIGHIGKEVAARIGVRVEWGGDWQDPWDPAHWQVANWRELVHVNCEQVLAVK